MPTDPPDDASELETVAPADPPRGLVGWFAAGIGEALQAAFAIAIGLVAGIFKALLSPGQAREDVKEEVEEADKEA